MKKLLLFILLISPFIGFSQAILTEAFEYTTGGLVANSGGAWVSNSGTAGSSVTTTGSLNYTGYFPGAVGGKVAISNGSTEDVIRSFTAVNGTGSKVYASFLINVTSTTSTGDYFVHFASGTGTFKARTFIKTSWGGFDIGIDGDGAVTSYLGGTVLNFNQTYLVVIGYSFNSGTNDDVVSLWLNPDISGAEPTANITKVVAGDYTSLSALGLRQAAGNTPTLSIDGLKLGLTWATSTLPITLTSFTGKEAIKSIVLNWATASEKNNKTFELFRSVDGKVFKSIGSINGAGDSDTELKYSFIDENPYAGTNYYQLMQHDFDGKTSSSAIISVDSKIAAAQLTVYASSFEVKISISSPNQTKATLQLFDIAGRKLAEQSVEVNKGFNSLSLPVSLQNGVHFVRYSTDSEVMNKKFVR